jgi:hypothetical protein
VWNSLDALYRFDAPDETTALLNLVSASDTATVIGTPTFRAQLGFSGDGGSGEINTNFNPSTASGNYSQNSAHISAWDNTSRAGAAGPIVSLDSGNGSFESDIYPEYTDGKTYIRVNDNPASAGFTASDTAGFFLGNRTSATTRQGYLNNVSVGTYGSTPSGAIPSGTFRFLVNDTLNTWSTDQVRGGSFGGGLTPTQSTDLYNRMSAFTTAVEAMPPFTYTLPTYLFSPLNNTTSLPMDLSASSDGITFTDWPTSLTPPTGYYFRDPSITQYDDSYWIVNTEEDSYSGGYTGFSLYESSDAMHWSFVPESGAFDDLRSALKARLKGLPRGL